MRTMLLLTCLCLIACKPKTRPPPELVELPPVAEQKPLPAPPALPAPTFEAPPRVPAEISYGCSGGITGGGGTRYLSPDGSTRQCNAQSYKDPATCVPGKPDPEEFQTVDRLLDEAKFDAMPEGGPAPYSCMLQRGTKRVYVNDAATRQQLLKVFAAWQHKERGDTP